MRDAELAEAGSLAAHQLVSTVDVMATASSRAESSHNLRGTSQLHAIVSCAKIKRKKSLFGAAIYVEATADGESRRTAKSHSSSNPKWDERLTLNVTPHSQLDFKYGATTL
ncbi:hypothetical protein WMY93_031331 [Mugilogobius chulae]|uniref:C2 domain-containing protein n=1 Tax=Mugilogobius chulae TaxID=88201 RepID=A0AAW0MDS8_9GOBI